MLLQGYKQGHLECGCDEAGRGCLAGPVVAAAVILPPTFENELLNDSKKLTEKQRNQLRLVIEAEALSWAIGIADHAEIDRLNILNASILAMHRAIDALALKPEFLIIDGNRFKEYPGIPHQTIIKGDSIYLSIAAASILAKTHRDEIMANLDKLFPEYHWKRNKAYPTKAHKEAIRRHGCTSYHRLTFKMD
jgi:ribonuclease HII